MRGRFTDTGRKEGEGGGTGVKKKTKNYTLGAIRFHTQILHQASFRNRKEYNETWWTDKIRLGEWTILKVIPELRFCFKVTEMFLKSHQIKVVLGKH